MTRSLSNGLGVVLVAHGERGGAFSNAVVKRHANAVAEALPDYAVAAGVLSGEPALESALDEVASRTNGSILIYPFFMAPGYFVNVKIPKRLAEAGRAERCRVLTPLGHAESLPLVIRNHALISAAELPISADQCRLILVGHGSKVARASAEATEMVAACLRELGGFALVQTAFLEESPFLAEVVVSDQRPTVVVGFFNGDGLHAAEDVPAALAAFDGPVTYTGPVGAFPEIAKLIADAVKKTAAEFDEADLRSTPV